MKFCMYSIRDRLTGFMTPVLDQTDALAIRNFRMACDSQKRDQSIIAFSPSDFSLYHIADFDSETGIISPISPLDFICQGDSFSEV